MTFSDPSLQQTADHWRDAVDDKIDQLGWRAFTRVEQPDSDVTIFMIDVTPAEDTVFHPEGPATFSLSVFLDGDGTLSVDGAVPFALKPAAVLFACNRQTRGENCVRAGRRLRVVDIRFEAALLKNWGCVSRKTGWAGDDAEQLARTGCVSGRIQGATRTDCSGNKPAAMSI